MNIHTMDILLRARGWKPVAAVWAIAPFFDREAYFTESFDDLEFGVIHFELRDIHQCPVAKGPCLADGSGLNDLVQVPPQAVDPTRI